MFQMIMGAVVAAVLSFAPFVSQNVEKIDTVSVLALIHIESTGDERARRPNSQYYGLLQISQAYLTDALEHEGVDAFPIEELMGDGGLSIMVMYWYMQRYSFIHEWEPLRIALVHKAGPNVSQEVIEASKGGCLIRAAGQSRIPSSRAYLKRFKEHREMYKEALGSI